MAKLNIGMRNAKLPKNDDFQESMFWQVKADERVKVTIAESEDQIVTGNRFEVYNWLPKVIAWWDLGEEDNPGVELGLKSRFRGFIPVVVPIEDSEGNIENKWRLWTVTTKQWLEIEEILELTESLKGLIVQASRKGSGKTDTVYSVNNSGRFNEELVDEFYKPLDDVIGLLGPQNRDGIIELIEDVSELKYSDVKKKLNPDSSSSDDDLDDLFEDE